MDDGGRGLQQAWCSRTDRVPVAEQVCGLGHSELQRLRELEAENSRLKRIVAQQALDINVLKELAS